MTLRPEYRLGGEIVMRPGEPAPDPPLATNYRRARHRQAIRPTPARAAWLAVLEGKIARARAEAAALVRPCSRATGKRRERLDRAIRKRWEREDLAAEAAK